MCVQMTQFADSFAAVLCDDDTVKEFDVLEHTGECAAVDGSAAEDEVLFEINCVAQPENYVVLFACWLLLHHYHEH